MSSTTEKIFKKEISHQGPWQSAGYKNLNGREEYKCKFWSDEQGSTEDFLC